MTSTCATSPPGKNRNKGDDGDDVGNFDAIYDGLCGVKSSVYGVLKLIILVSSGETNDDNNDNVNRTTTTKRKARKATTRT